MTELTVTRKDLQDAAKAAGVKLNPFGVKDGTKQGDERLIGFMTDPTVWKGGWFNPEHDLGESFELAFRLKMCVDFEEALVMMPSGDSINFELGNIKEACKAIVLAAAEIGRAKEMSRFYEEPDGNPHNICVAAINRLLNENKALRQQLAEVSKPTPIKESDMKTSEFSQGYLAGRVAPQVIIDDQAKSIESLRRQLVDANQDLDDMKEATLIVVQYYKSKPAKQFETLRKALNKIAKLDPEFDSDEGFNEWGEADCFRKAQKIAIAATKPKEQGK